MPNANVTITADTTPARLALITADLYHTGDTIPPGTTGNAGASQVTVPVELAAELRAELDTRGIAHD